jgi:hypothetical protein
MAHRPTTANVSNEFTSLRLHFLQRQFAVVERLHRRLCHTRGSGTCYYRSAAGFTARLINIAH